MKKLFLVIGCLFLFGCNETKDLDIDTPRYDNWTLDYMNKVKIGDQELYNCTYSRVYAYQGFGISILSNTECKQKL